MFIRTKTTPNSPRQSIQIVEGERDKQGRVKQRIVHHVGIARDADEAEKLKAYGQELILKIKAERLEIQRQTQPTLFPDHPMNVSAHNNRSRGRPAFKRLKDILPPSQVPLSEIVEEKRVVEGIHDVAGRLYDDLGFHKLLTKGHAQTLKDMVLMRLSEPTSKRDSCRLLREHFDQSLRVERVYRMMDQLEQHLPTVQNVVRNASLRLLKEKVDILLFDVTTLYFESVDTDGLREFGYSKDQKYHCVQVVLALMTSGDGLPLGYELFEGNFAEVKTLQKCLNTWKANGFDIGTVCLAADAAMFSKGNLDLLEQMNISYVVSAPLRKLKAETKQQILEEQEYRLGMVQKDLMWVKELELPKDTEEKKPETQDSKTQDVTRRLIVSYSAARAHKDRKDRERLLEKLSKKLGKQSNVKKLVSNRGYLKYVKEEGQMMCHLNEEKVATEALWDGMHGIVTNAPKTEEALELLSRYRRLWVIEESFRINKHTLKMRPIYHYKSQRIQSHIAICYLAFALMRHLEYRVKIAQEKLSPQEILRALNGVQASIVQHTKTKDRYRLPSALQKEARMIYKALGITRDQNVDIYRHTF